MSSDRVHERVTDDQGLRLVEVILDRAREFIAGLTPEQIEDILSGRAQLAVVDVTEDEHKSD